MQIQENNQNESNNQGGVMISTKTHGLMDYLMGVVLIIAPFIFDFATGGAVMWVPIIIGITVILYSLFTDYEYGASPIITMRTHLTLDITGGLLLAVSPWLFGFADFVFWPHLILGLAEVLAALMTEKVPQRSPKRATQSV